MAVPIETTPEFRAGLDETECREWLDSGRGQDEVADHLEFAAENGLTSVPTFVVDRKVAVPGAQQPELFVEFLEGQLTASSALGPDEDSVEDQGSRPRR